MTHNANEIRDVATERAVLGLVLGGLSPSDVGLPAEAFTGAGRHIWDAMLALHNEPRKIDHITVCECLLRRGRLAECGGPAGITSLERAMPQDPITGAQDATGLPGYLEILRDRMQRRAVVAAADLARAQAMDLNTKPLVAAAAAVSSFGAIRGERTLKRGGQLMFRVVDRWDANLRAEAEGRHVTPCLPWPHEGMDTGIPRGRVSVVAGRSGNFKTGLVSDGMYFWANSMKEPGGLIGLEDGCDWFMERLTGRAIGVPYEQVGYAHLDAGQQVSLQNWCGAAHNVLEERVFYEDYSETGDAASSISFPEVFSVIQRMTEAGAKWIVIDHGLRIDWMKGAQTERYDMAIGQGMARCSRYAERTGVAIVFLWHLNRAQQEGTVPQRSDLKESGYVDAEARKIYVLWKQAHRQGVQLVTTVKATKGEEGVTTALPLTDAVYGLLSRTGGYRVDFEAEAAEAKRRADETRRANTARARGMFSKVES